jgi:hypothetical protein
MNNSEPVSRKRFRRVKPKLAGHCLQRRRIGKFLAPQDAALASYRKSRNCPFESFGSESFGSDETIPCFSMA